MMAVKLHSAQNAQMIYAGKQNFHMETQQQKITKANFCFPKYSILISQSCVDTIGKFKRIEKLTLHVISHS